MPTADLGSSFHHFFNAAAEFFRHLSEIHWTAFGVALLRQCYGQLRDAEQKVKLLAGLTEDMLKSPTRQVGMADRVK